MSKATAGLDEPVHVKDFHWQVERFAQVRGDGDSQRLQKIQRAKLFAWLWKNRI
jgi:hypothetical protein